MKIHYKHFNLFKKKEKIIFKYEKENTNITTHKI